MISNDTIIHDDLMYLYLLGTLDHEELISAIK
jgi:hypothetical protein